MRRCTGRALECFVFPLLCLSMAALLGSVAGNASADGPVVAWGQNGSGQATPPPEVDGTVGTASAISAGADHSCAIQAESGAVVCWGDNQYGQTTTPREVNGKTGTAIAIAAGGFHTCAIQAETDAVISGATTWTGRRRPPTR